MVRKDTGASVYSKTSNLTKRLAMLKYNLASINGNGTARFERFVPFIGATLSDVDFEIYPYSNTINASTV
jgi:hypothetical protein